MKELTGRHVLIILLSFFGVTAAVNGVFIYAAVSTFSGRGAVHPYEQGLHYNTLIAAEREQDALDWTHKTVLSNARTVSITFKDKNGLLVKGLELRGEIGRPASDHFTRKLIFAEVKPGVYNASVARLEAGSWIAEVTASAFDQGKERPLYRIKERLWHKPKQ